ncbi:uncharacterized protein [Mytilus edulis]|uniref:uncharacterized protein n=1 Tax=Mytilus edulis TaxID=6550 RepID=UPI0039EF5251
MKMAKLENRISWNEEIKASILALVQKRGPTKTCCPSEVARKLSPNNWRGLMEFVRDAARELQQNELIDICQKGIPVITKNWTGPIRLRLRTKSGISLPDIKPDISEQSDRCRDGDSKPSQRDIQSSQATCSVEYGADTEECQTRNSPNAINRKRKYNTRSKDLTNKK